MNLNANHSKSARLHDLPTHPDDWFLAQQCVAGDSGAQRQLRAILDSFVKGCLRHRGASYTEAEDIAGDIASEIPADSEKDFCLLRKYKGKCSLKNWLSRVAINRWIDLKRREIFVVQLPSGKGEDSPSPIERIPSQEAGVPEDFLLNLLRTCLRPAFGACTAEQLLMLRLVYLEDLSQSEVGMMWGWHRSKVNRALRATRREIESRTLSRLSIIDPWLAVSWDDFLNMYDIGFFWKYCKTKRKR
jgi:RNA polymerase sigma factor (sigma-70 family)